MLLRLTRLAVQKFDFITNETVTLCGVVHESPPCCRLGVDRSKHKVDCVFLVASGADDSKMSLYKLLLDGEEAAADAK